MRETQSREKAAQKTSPAAAGVTATVVESLPNELFRLELEDRSKILAHVSHRSRNAFLRLLPGDRVRVELSPYDAGRGRITEQVGS